MHIVMFFRPRGRHYRRRYRAPGVRDKLRQTLDEVFAKIAGKHSRIRRQLREAFRQSEDPHMKKS